LYIAEAERRLKPTTMRVTRAFLESFATQHGELRARDVRRFHVEAWVRAHPTWGPTTERLAKTRVVTLFQFGVEQGLLAGNPVRGIRKPAQRSRGTQALIAPEHHARLIEAAEPCFRNVLLALHGTGARPGEVTSVSAADFNEERGIWVVRNHKNAHKGQQRVVYLTPSLVELCRGLAAKFPDGPLFRDQWGRPYGWCGLSKRLAWLREKLGLPATITVYGYRHTFATDALSQGVPDAQVAELLGHAGTTMLHRHYSHLGEKAEALRGALGRVR
jgi:integrase